MNTTVTAATIDNAESQPVKRTRGRPKKYANPEEQKEARRAQILQSVRKHRQQRAQTKTASNEKSTANGATTAEDDDDRNDQSEGVPAEDNTKSTTLVKVIPAVEEDAHDEFAIAMARYNRYKPAELIMANSSMLVDGLVSDFLVRSLRSSARLR
jgi:hypothetical protein